MRSIIYILLGVVFGVTMYKAETASWFRIYEMFNFQSFHMYGFIGSALAVGLLGIQLFKKKNVKDADGEPIHFQPKINPLLAILLAVYFLD
jgi:hypothetical protein